MAATSDDKQECRDACHDMESERGSETGVAPVSNFWSPPGGESPRLNPARQTARIEVGDVCDRRDACPARCSLRESAMVLFLGEAVPTEMVLVR